MVLKISPTVLNTPTVLKIFLHIYHDIPYSTEHPPGTQDIPHMHHDIHHGTAHPHSTAHTERKIITTFVRYWKEK